MNKSISVNIRRGPRFKYKPFIKDRRWREYPWSNMWLRKRLTNDAVEEIRKIKKEKKTIKKNLRKKQEQKQKQKQKQKQEQEQEQEQEQVII